MKFHNTSGNKAASPETTSSSPSKSPLTTNTGPQTELPSAHPAVLSDGSHQLQFTYVTSPVIPIEPLVTKRTVCEHYHMGLRTLDYAITLGLPVVPVGRNVRFKFSQVQPWLEKNGYRRLAKEGRKAAIEKALLKSKQFQFALSSEVQVTNDKDKTKPKKKSD
jgi:hypothetical protein